MESRKNLDPKKRKSIHNKVDYDEIRDNVKNSVLKAQSKRMSNNQLENDDRDIVSSDEDEEKEDDLLEEEILINQTYDVRLRRRQRGSVPPPELKAKTALKAKSLYEEKIKKINETVSATKITNVKKANTQKPVTNCKHNAWKVYLIVIVFIVIFAYAFGRFNNTLDLPNVFSGDAERKVLTEVRETLRSLRSKYKNQDPTLWNDAYLGISELIKTPHKPSIILLLGNKSDPLDCLAILLGNVSSNALNSGRLTLTPNEFESDMGSVIENMRVLMKDNKAVVVWDLLNINTEALKAFHNLCDRINPLVEEVIYIITIISNDYDSSKNPTEFIEKKLLEKLSGKVKHDAIQPLITRITDGHILTVKPEPTITDCPLPKASKRT